MRSFLSPTRQGVAALVASTMLCAGVALTATGAAARDGAGTGVTDPTKLDQAFVELWNAQRFDEMPGLLTDDVVFVIPNREPAKGVDQAIALMKQLRPLFGEFAPGAEIHREVRTKDTYSRSVSYALKNGVRANDTEVITRQSDGTWRYAIAQTGLRDPLR